MKLFLQRFDDTVIGQPECHTLINDPCFESMPIELIGSMRLEHHAYRLSCRLDSIPFQTIVGYNFLGSISRRDNINNGSL